MPTTGPIPLVGRVSIGLTPDNRVIIIEANIPALEAGIMMLELAKLELFAKLKQVQAEAAERLIETPSGNFNPDKIPPGGILRT